MAEQLEDSINGIDAMSCIESWESINETPLDFQTPQPHLVCHEFSNFDIKSIHLFLQKPIQYLLEARRVSYLKLGVTGKLPLEKIAINRA